MNIKLVLILPLCLVLCFDCGKCFNNACRTGSSCEKSTGDCTGGCNDRGTTDPNTGGCTCFDLYKGDNCETYVRLGLQKIYVGALTLTIGMKLLQ